MDITKKNILDNINFYRNTGFGREKTCQRLLKFLNSFEDEKAKTLYNYADDLYKSDLGKKSILINLEIGVNKLYN